MSKISSLTVKGFDNKPLYDDKDKYIKTKIKSYGGNVNTNFRGKKSTKRKCIIEMSLITLVSVIEVNKKYYPKHL